MDLLEAEHVEQRHLDVDGVKEFRMLNEFDAHQEAAVGTAFDAEAAGAGDLLRDDVPCNGGEVIEDVLPVRLETGLMPGRPELAAAANVREDEDAAACEPELA